MVRTLPAVSALRRTWPEASISWLVEPASRGALDGQPWVDDVIVFPRDRIRGAARRLRLRTLVQELFMFARDLRARDFDLVVDFHSILKSGLLSRLSGAPVRAAYARPYGRELGWLFANRRARLTPAHASRFDRNQAMLRFLGSTEEPAPHPLCVADAARDAMQRALGDRPGPVVLHPGTSDGTPHKRYTVEGYAEVSRTLARESGRPVILSVGTARDDRRFAEAIIEAAGGAAELAPDTPTLSDLAALFACCRVYVGSDTGPLHVASLVGTPVVQIMGPTHPVENMPYPGTPSKRARVPVGCSPCRRGCSAATCMRVIPPAMVIDAAARLLAADSVG